MSKPSIRERLDYVEICNAAEQYYKECYERDMDIQAMLVSGQMVVSEEEKEKRNKALIESIKSNGDKARTYHFVRGSIVEDLIKDPAFVEYFSYLATKEKQTIINSEQNSIITNSQQSDSKDIQTGTLEPHEPSSYEEYVEMFGEENTSIADYHSRYKNNADYTPAFDPDLDSRYPSGQFVDQFVDDALGRAGRK